MRMIVKKKAAFQFGVRLFLNPYVLESHHVDFVIIMRVKCISLLE